jgi:EAL domain-containing protein (putative c-di-GMP-specific phosphodiesterase class I)
VKHSNSRRVVERIAREDVRARSSGRRTRELGLDEHDLARALTSGELVLHYQPIVEIRSGACRRVEALLRWQHPGLGQLLPGEFLSLAKSAALQDAISQWVIRAAWAQQKAWRDQGEPLGVSVNLSRHDTTQIERIAASVRGVETGAVTFEIRPGDLDAADLRLAALRLSAAGVDVALDDVGLEDAPSRALAATIDELKIARSLVKRAVAGSQARQDLRALIELGRDYRFSLVAVGVEDRRTYELVAALGCDMAQGYWVSRPLVPDRLREARRWAVGLAFTGAVAFATQAGAGKVAASGGRAIQSSLTIGGLFSSACCLDLPAVRDGTALTAAVKLEQLQSRTGLRFSTGSAAGADIFVESGLGVALQESVATAVERDIAELEQEFGRQLATKPSIYIFATRTNFALGLQQVFGVRGPDAGVLAAANGGIALPRQGAIAINLQNVNAHDLTVIRHELAHSMVNEMIGSDGSLPTWLHEGIATLEERGHSADEFAGAWSSATALAVLSAGATTLGDLEPANQWIQRNAMLEGKAYTVSAEAVRLLEQRVSHQGLLRILESVGHGESFGAAFIAEAGESPGEFERAFPARLAADRGDPRILQARDARGVRWSLAGFRPNSSVVVSIDGNGYSLQFQVTTDEYGMYQAVFGETAPKGEYTLRASLPGGVATALMVT